MTSPCPGPVAVEVRGIEKTFRIPNQRVTRLKERVLHPLAMREKRDLQALKSISFDIGRGEFFGIVGRNGSGKSTLLKILASIYAADAGRVRMAGLPAPFIELGVGFNMELSARENVELNGVMMGLPRQTAIRRLDAILEFAELEEFVDMKLKNYSSGMLVRLAFSVMIQSDADILLIDEVLAVGDAAFQQKCADVFREIRDSDRTVVLVTHDMSAVETYCHRAMLLHDGELESIGDPGEVARRYLQLNFVGEPTDLAAGTQGGDPDPDVRLAEIWLEDADGNRKTSFEQGSTIVLQAVFEAKRDVRGPSCGFMFTNADGVDVFGFGKALSPFARSPEQLTAGERVRVSCTVENRFAAGRHVVKCWIHRNRSYADLILHSPQALDFVVFGREDTPGVVSIAHEVSAVTEDRGRG